MFDNDVSRWNRLHAWKSGHIVVNRNELKRRLVRALDMRKVMAHRFLEFEERKYAFAWVKSVRSLLFALPVDSNELVTAFIEQM